MKDTTGIDELEVELERERAMDDDNKLIILKKNEAFLQELQKDKTAAREHEAFMDGWLAKSKFIADFNRLTDLMALYRLRQEKEYRKQGLTWAEYCEKQGYSIRSVTRWLEEFTPVYESFSANIGRFFGVPLNKIKYLSKAISANMAVFDGQNLVVADEAFPAGTSDEMSAAIDALEEKLTASEKAAKKLQDEITESEKEHTAELKELKKTNKELRTKVVDPEVPENFKFIFKEIERQTTEIVIQANRLNFSRTFADAENELALKMKYTVAINVMETQFRNVIEALRDAVIGN